MTAGQNAGRIRVIGYLRVSTEDQEYGIDAQRADIQAEADHREWEVQWVEDRASGKSLSRVGMGYALNLLDQREVAAIVVSRLDRLSRSVLDFATVLARAEAGGWNVIVLDLGLDLSTPHGEFTAHVMAAAAQLERRLIGLRTKAALRVARDQHGVRLGRPAVIPDNVARRVVRERAVGRTFQSIADGLNDDGVPTSGRSQRWTRGTVAALHDRHARASA